MECSVSQVGDEDDKCIAIRHNIRNAHPFYTTESLLASFHSAPRRGVFRLFHFRWLWFNFGFSFIVAVTHLQSSVLAIVQAAQTSQVNCRVCKKAALHNFIGGILSTFFCRVCIAMVLLALSIVVMQWLLIRDGFRSFDRQTNITVYEYDVLASDIANLAHFVNELFVLISYNAPAAIG